MKGSIYIVSYLLRKTSMTLTEIRCELELGTFRELLDEVVFQESVAEYQTAMYVANILATIANTVPRKTAKTSKAADFLNMKEPRRSGKDAVSDAKAELEALATKFKIKLPAREIREL